MFKLQHQFNNIASTQLASDKMSEYKSFIHQTDGNTERDRQNKNQQTHSTKKHYIKTADAKW